MIYVFRLENESEHLPSQLSRIKFVGALKTYFGNSYFAPAIPKELIIKIIKKF